MMFNGKQVNPYRILEIGEDASEEEIKRKYRALSHQYHPDCVASTPHNETAIRLVSEAYAEVIANLRRKKKEAREQALKNDNYDNLDDETLKNVIIEKFTRYITDYQVAKVTCELYHLNLLDEVKELFSQAIAVANNCISLVRLAQSREEILQVNNIFKIKIKKFDENFYSDVGKLLVKELVFIYYAKEVQTIIGLLSRPEKKSANEWFMDNYDALVSVVSYDNELTQKLDSTLASFMEDDAYQVLEKEIKEMNMRFVGQANDLLMSKSLSFHEFNEDFIEAYHVELDRIFTRHHETMDRRQSKIRYLKFAFNIDDEMVERLNDAILDEEVFNQLVDSVEKERFESLITASQARVPLNEYKMV